MANIWKGRCYEAAYEHCRPGELVVHGFPVGTGKIEGLVYGHAWIEVPTAISGIFAVRDLTMDIEDMPAPMYYLIGGDISARPMKRYTFLESRKLAFLHEHYGTWPDPNDPRWHEYIERVASGGGFR